MCRGKQRTGDLEDLVYESWLCYLGKRRLRIHGRASLSLHGSTQPSTEG
jgi:hypothetical protein